MTYKERKRGTVVATVDIKVSTQMVRKVPIRLLKTERKRGLDTFEYVIDVDEPAKVYVKASTPEEVQELARAEFEEALSLTWKDWIMVEVQGGERLLGNEDADDRGALSIRLRLVQTAIKNGNKCWREVREKLVDPDPWNKNGKKGQLEIERQFGSYTNDGWPVSEQPTADDDHGGYSSSYANGFSDTLVNGREISSLVEDTPENRERLVAIIKALHQLTAQVQDLLSPNKIELTLAANSLPLLPAAPVECTPPAKTAKRKRSPLT